MPAWPVINQLWFPERHFSANGISLRLGKVQMKFYERSMQALLSSAPFGFAARSRALARLVSLAQIGELARRLPYLRRWATKFVKFQTVGGTVTKLSLNIITAQKSRKGLNDTAKYNYTNGRRDWTKLKKIKIDFNCGFWKPVHLSVFQGSVMLLVTIDWFNSLKFHCE